MDASYFYNYNATKNNSYNKFAFGTLTVSDKTDDFDLLECIKDIADKDFPDADNINITALNRI